MSAVEKFRLFLFFILYQGFCYASFDIQMLLPLIKISLFLRTFVLI